MSVTAPAITGIGLSPIGRKLGLDGLDLGARAIMAAIEDAGLTPSDIDGLACWPGRQNDGTGLSPVGVWDVQDAFGFDLNWYAGGFEGPAQLASVINACLAIRSGMARHVVCFRVTTEASTRIALPQKPVGDWPQWLAPFGSLSLVNWVAQGASHYMHRYGITPEQLGAIALNARHNAALNPLAIKRDPLTMEDYLASRMIASPLRLLDCDIPVDGAVAFVVSDAAAARDCRHQPVTLEAASCKAAKRTRWDQVMPEEWSMFEAGPALWAKTDFKPGDVDMAQLYDGFSVLTLLWLEALGFCRPGEAGVFVEGGERIGIAGVLPLATGGGQLSGGRLHGLGHLHEAVIQLRGHAGERQVAGSPQVAVVANGAGPLASCALLVRR
jgi:acetyl-CoA acetyltransferase